MSRRWHILLLPNVLCLWAASWLQYRCSLGALLANQESISCATCRFDSDLHWLSGFTAVPLALLFSCLPMRRPFWLLRMLSLLAAWAVGGMRLLQDRLWGTHLPMEYLAYLLHHSTVPAIAFAILSTALLYAVNLLFGQAPPAAH